MVRKHQRIQDNAEVVQAGAAQSAPFVDAGHQIGAAIKEAKVSFYFEEQKFIIEDESNWIRPRFID